VFAPCPCGSGSAYDACCGPLHRGAREAQTPEQLMRARYAAYALNENDYVLRTWHPRTQPADVLPHTVRWTGLTIHGSGPDWVEFTARFMGPGGEGSMHERSRFELRRGRWVYVDGDVT
jgi:SEC-C motif-containing protein